jgi:Tfp pilus assembly protein PilZ
MRIESTPESKSPEQAKLRRATRYYFGGVVELTDLESERMIVALVRSLSLYGCFVKTDQSFSLGAKLMLKMTHSGSHFSAHGCVVNQTEVGIGVEFTEIDPGDRSRLEECLAELARTDNVQTDL